MCNNWLTIGNIVSHGYRAMIATGMLAGIWLAEKQAKKYGLKFEYILDLILWNAF